MAKTRSVFFCSECGHESPQWVGKCPTCNSWNTFVEQEVAKASKRATPGSSGTGNAPTPIAQVDPEQQRRVVLEDGELNRVLGGGLVPGSVILFGGEPGIGKSTLMLQLVMQHKGLKTLYVSGEESQQQIRMRADRIGATHDNAFLLTETSTTHIRQHLKTLAPELVVIDSIQTLHAPTLDAAPGSVSQIRESASELLRYAKEEHVPIFLIGHITKEGALAGPKLLEHMVDVVLQFEGDRNHTYRLLRSVKNRFGSTNELGIYEMQGSGLREVDNPSEILISQGDEALSGSAIAATIEGMRPMLIEIQALVSTAVYGTPQRSATGFDLRRMNMLLAVLEKRCGFRLGTKDVFLNMAGGIRVDDPASDLAVVCAVLSSDVDVALDPGVAFAAEVGLSGEIRPVNRVDQRISEAQKLGFKRIFVSRHNKGLDTGSYSIEVVQVGKIQEVFKKLFA